MMGSFVRTAAVTWIAISSLLTMSARAEDGERPVGDLRYESHTLTAEGGVEIQAQRGSLIVPENRSRPDGRRIELVFALLKSRAAEPGHPLVYLHGGPGGSATPAVRSPYQLALYNEFLDERDVILLDQRACGESSPKFVYRPEELPSTEIFRSEASLRASVRAAHEKAAARFRAEGVDFDAYDSVESAHDLEDLRVAIGAEKLNLLGFSYGTHLAQAMIRTHPESLDNVVICGVEGLDMTFKYPLRMDTQFRKLGLLVARDPELGKKIPDLVALFERVCAKLDEKPMVVKVRGGGNQTFRVPVGSYLLKMLLRFDIGDASDLPVFPRLLYSIDQGDRSVLTWFVGKRLALFGSINVASTVMDAASGGSPARLRRIEDEARVSLFGDVMNFPTMAVRDLYGDIDLGDAYRAPLVSDIRTLFLSGSLDWNTPPQQAEEVRWGFSRSTHLVVENAGHEQVLPQPAIRDAIRRFLAGEAVGDVHVELPPLRFVPLEGHDPERSHPAVRP